MKTFLPYSKTFGTIVLLLSLSAFNFGYSLTNYYSAGNNAPNVTTNWWTNADGTGSHPANFTSSNAVYNIQSGHTMTTTANWSVSGTGSTINILSGGTLIASNTVTSSNMSVTSGATYQHNLDGGTIPTAIWNAASTCSVTGWGSTTTAPGGINQNFGNFIWNSAGQTGALSLGGALNTVNGNFTVTATGSGSVSLGGTGAGNLSIGGNYSQTGGTFIGSVSAARSITIAGDFSLTGGTIDLSSSTTAGNPVIVNIAGNFTHSGGILSETGLTTGSGIIFNGTGTQTYTSGGTLSNLVNFTVNSPTTLQMGTAASPATISSGSGGIFTLAAGATLGITSTAGITGSGTAAGNIQVTGTRTYASGANYIYNGTAAQVTGNGLTLNTPANLTLSNSAGVTLSGTTAISGALIISQGPLSTSTSNFNMSIGGNWTNNGGFTAGTGTVTLNGSNQQAIGGSSSTTFYKLIISNSNGAILGTDQTVNNTLSLTGGNFDLSNKILTMGPSAIPISGAFTSMRMIIADGGGQIRKSATSNSTASYSFPIGDNSSPAEYSPITLSVIGSAYSSAYIGVSLGDAKHSNNASTTNYLTRYWSITQSGITSCVATVTGTFLSSDVTGTTGSIKAAQLDGTFNQQTNPWKKTGGSTLSGTTLTYTSASLTTGQTSIFTGITSAIPTVSIIGGGITICSGTNVNLGTMTTGDSTITYSWSPSSFLSSSTIANPIVTNPTATTAYAVTIKDGNGISATSASSTVTVNTLPNNTSDGFTGGTICPGDIGKITYDAYTINTPFIPPYKISFTDGTNTWSNYSIGSASPIDITVNATASTTYTLTSITDGNNCVRTNGFGNSTAHIAVRATFTAGAINTTGEAICYNGNPGVIGYSAMASGGDGIITYKWQADGADIPGANAITYDPPAGLKASTTYTRWANDGTCNTTPTQSTGSWMVSIRPNFTPGTISTVGETICYDGNPRVIDNSTMASGGDESITYKWQANGIDIPSANAITYDPPTGLKTTTIYTRWANDSSCNTTPTQATGSWMATVTSTVGTPTAITISAGIEPICQLADGISSTTYTTTSTNSSEFNWSLSNSAAGSIDPTTGVMTWASGFSGSVDIVVTASGCSNTSPQEIRTVLINNLPSAPTVGEIMQPSCPVLTGAVVLNDLPSTGTWTINPGGIIGTGCSRTVSELPAGLNNFTVTDGSGCISSQSNPVTITDIIKRWVGTNGSDWFTDSNWNPEGVPDATSCVEIPNNGIASIAGTNSIAYTNALIVSSGGKLNVDSGNTLVVQDFVNVQPEGRLTFQDTSSLIQVNNASDLNKGNIIVSRNSTPIVLNDYTYWSSPTLGTQTLLQFSPKSNPKYFLTYDDIWSYVDASSTTFSSGVGYAVIAPKGVSPTVFTGTFIGVPNNGNVTVPVLSGSTSPSYKLIGNPYPSALDPDEFIKANIYDAVKNPSGTISGTLYFWTHSHAFADGTYASDNYSTYNWTGWTETEIGTGNSVGPKRWIASGQGFVAEIVASGGIIFTNDMRGSGNGTINGNFYKNVNVVNTVVAGLEKNRIWLNLTNGSSNFSQTLIGYIETATSGYDPGFDGAYFSNSNIGIYSFLGNDIYTIQAKALPFADSDVVTLGYKTDVTGNMTVSIDNVDGLFIGNQNIFIEDKLLNTIHNLKAGPYTFITQAGTFNDRFALKYTETTLGLNDPKEISENIIISSKNQQIKVQSTMEDIAKVFVYDMLGRIIYQNSEIDVKETVISDLKTQQVLIVKVVLGNGQTTSKKVVY